MKKTIAVLIGLFLLSAFAGTVYYLYSKSEQPPLTFETRSPVRAFTVYNINEEPHLVAGYTCTPLVKFPLSDLKPGNKIRGITVAELGNRNRPLDMFVYETSFLQAFQCSKFIS